MMSDSPSAEGPDAVRAPKKARKEQWMYEDEHPSEHGILLANRIHELCEEGLLISDDYEAKNLRPAAYTLRIGDNYIDSDGVVQQLSDQKKSIVFRKNSIIFVSTLERLELPYYIIARFNLRVNWVYNGILLGTGPQVDPGFSGYLSCPLYNLTETDIIIDRRQEFATIDFEKTTELLRDITIEGRKTLIRNARNKQLQTVGDQTYTFYTAGSLAPLGWRKDHKIVSSLTEMETDLRTWRNLGIGAVVAFFGLTLSLLAFGANLYRQYSDLNRQLMNDANVMNQTTTRITRIEDVVDRIKSSIAEKQNAAPQGQVDSQKGKRNQR
jgi:deoxycytidine triphosphate deaminase